MSQQHCRDLEISELDFEIKCFPNKRFISQDCSLFIENTQICEGSASEIFSTFAASSSVIEPKLMQKILIDFWLFEPKLLLNILSSLAENLVHLKRIN